MLFVWDEPKRALNLIKHGLDFADFSSGFDYFGCVTRPARDSRTGRKRFRLIGTFRGDLIAAVIASPLGSEAMALISFRIANPAERRVYEQDRPRSRLRPES